MSSGAVKSAFNTVTFQAKVEVLKNQDLCEPSVNRKPGGWVLEEQSAPSGYRKSLAGSLVPLLFFFSNPDCASTYQERFFKTNCRMYSRALEFSQSY